VFVFTNTNYTVSRNTHTHTLKGGKTFFLFNKGSIGKGWNYLWRPVETIT